MAIKTMVPPCFDWFGGLGLNLAGWRPGRLVPPSFGAGAGPWLAGATLFYGTRNYGNRLGLVGVTLFLKGEYLS